MEDQELLRRAQSLKDWLVDIRRDFHQNPELGMGEIRTGKKIIGYLDDMGIAYKTGIASTGIMGIINGGKPGRTIALRADMDALPMEDEKDVPYRSKVKGRSHSCGHDAHMTILLGTARILSEMKDKLSGNVKLFFQPAEESEGGARSMIEEGVMENPGVDAVFGLHVAPEIPTGKIGIKYGQMNAASDSIKIILHGESIHGAYPHGGIDTIVMAGHVITVLQTIVSRNVDPRNSVVVTIGAIHGGNRGNIIANRVEMIGTVRTLDSITRRKVMERIKRVVSQICEAMGGHGEVLTEEGYTALINEDAMVDRVKNNGIALLGPDNVVELKQPSLGVEDFAYFLQRAPGAFFKLGCGNEGKGIIHGGHSTLFDIDEDCLAIGVSIQVKNVLKGLEEM